MKTFQQFIAEMALNIGDADEVYNQKPIRQREFNKSKGHMAMEYNTGNENITVHKNTKTIGDEDESKQETSYHTNDNRTGETLHHATFVTHNPTTELPFHHDEQTAVNRQRSGDLPKGYATDFTYNHFKNSEHPLRSSDMQMTGGHEMWKRLAHKALNNGDHVYYHDSNKLHKSTKQNVDSHLKNYFGWTNDADKADYGSRHMILSKKEL